MMILCNKTLPTSGPLSYLHASALKIWTSYCERWLRWYGHVECSNSAVKTAFDIQIVGKRGPGRPKMALKQLTERDCREWKLSAIDPHDRDTWRSGVRSAMRAASKLPRRAAHCCGYCPCTCTLIKNPMMMMIMMMQRLL